MSTPRAEQLLRMLEQMPDDPRCLYGLGMEYLGAGDAPRAAEWLGRAAAVAPDDAYTWYHFARALHAADRHEEAARALNRGEEAAGRSGDSKAAGEIEALRDTFGL